MADIIELLERRDEQELELLKEKYADYCYSVIYHEQAEEAISDVWLRIWNSIPPLMREIKRSTVPPSKQIDICRFRDEIAAFHEGP